MERAVASPGFDRRALFARRRVGKIEAVFRPVFFVHEGEPCRAQSQAWQQPQQQQVTAREPRERRVILADIAAAEE